MRKNGLILFVILFFSHFSTYSQVRFMVREVCTDTVLSYPIRTVSGYYGDFLVSDYCYVSDDKNKYYLPDKEGYYNLKPGQEYSVSLYAEGKGMTTWNREFSYFVADAEKKDVVVDMYKIDEYFEILVGAPPDEGAHYYWYDCNGLCDGQLTDYYENGNIRLKGKFKQGKPVGKLYFYKDDGNLDYIKKYSRKGRLLRTVKK